MTSPSYGWRRIGNFLVGEQDALRMRIFECLFTVTFLLWVGRNFLTWLEWLTEEGFHLTSEELRAMGFPPPWPLFEPWQVALFGGMIALSAAAILLNRSRRAGLIAIFFCALYAQRIDYIAASSLNQLFIGVFALLALAPAMARAGSGKDARLLQSVAPLRVVQATLILQYFAAGLAKVNGDWLAGGDILWGQIQGVYRSETAAWALRNLPQWVWTAQQHAALAFGRSFRFAGPIPA